MEKALAATRDGASLKLRVLANPGFLDQVVRHVQGFARSVSFSDWLF